MSQLSLPLLGLAGVNSHPMRGYVEAACGATANPLLVPLGKTPLLGVAGNFNSSLPWVQDAMGLGDPRRMRGTSISERTPGLARYRTCFFLDWSYITGRERGTVKLRWKPGYDRIYGPRSRKIPLLLDCGAFRANSGAKDVEDWITYDNYLTALNFLQPDGYAAFDHPGATGRAQTMHLLRDLMARRPQDVAQKIWPIFGSRWVGPADRINPTLLPRLWNRVPYRSLVPSPVPPTSPARKGAFTKWTQGVDGWATQTIKIGLSIVRDPDFQFMANTFGRVMIGGMNKAPMKDPTCEKGWRFENENEVPTARCARHLLALVIRHHFPDLKIWMLGQASYVVVNGLGMHDRLQDFFMDGCWYINDSKAEMRAIYNLKHKVIRTEPVIVARTKAEEGEEEQAGLTRGMLICQNLIALESAYVGLRSFPDLPEPVNLSDRDEMAALITKAKQAQLEVGKMFGGAA